MKQGQMGANDTGFVPKQPRYVVVLAGGNLGDVKTNLMQALTSLESQLGVPIRASELYLSEPWGMEGAPPFVNQAWLFETDWSVARLMDALLHIEWAMGRERSHPERGYQNRTVDLDIILADGEVYEGSLHIPHPRMHLRRFALVPLVELWPEWHHPQMGLTAAELLERCEDQGVVKRWSAGKDG
jgi:2-amino-4-hydroxy-6-hydroxymethyldihydropteridine diphosphokinase